MYKSIKKTTRKFLNKKEGIAIIQCGLELSAYSVFADVTITDCSRQISLDFNAYDAKEYDVKLEKLELIINELAEFYTTMALYKKDWVDEQESRKVVRNKKENIVTSLNDLLN
jgi:hypothetical protein